MRTLTRPEKDTVEQTQRNAHIHTYIYMDFSGMNTTREETKKTQNCQKYAQDLWYVHAAVRLPPSACGWNMQATLKRYAVVEKDVPGGTHALMLRHPERREQRTSNKECIQNKQHHRGC